MGVTKLAVGRYDGDVKSLGRGKEPDSLDDLAKFILHDLKDDRQTRDPADAAPSHLAGSLSDGSDRHQPSMTDSPIIAREHGRYILKGGRQDMLTTKSTGESI
jgi:hypothetical protein